MVASLLLEGFPLLRIGSGCLGAEGGYLRARFSQPC
jgi:hypothetical protein